MLRGCRVASTTRSFMNRLQNPARDSQRTVRMLDPKLLRENPDAVKEATRIKRVGSSEMVDAWLAADTRRRSAQTRADALKSEQKKVGDQVGQLKRQLKGGTTSELEKLLAQASDFKIQAQALADEQ